MKCVKELLEIDSKKKLASDYVEKERAALNKIKCKSKKKVKKKNKRGVPVCEAKTYSAFLKSKYWEYVKKKVLRRDKYKCTVCGKTTTLQVHHTTYKHHKKEHKHLNDLLTVCDNCHYEIHLLKDIN